MKIKVTLLISALFLLCSAYSWGQTWSLTPTMTATLVNGTLTVSTTKDAEAMPDNSPWYNIGSNILSVVIRDSVTSIGNFAFGNYHNYPNLTSVKMGSSVTTIGARAFYSCTSLASLTIPNSVITIGQEAFLGCTSLASVTIGSSVTTIGGGAFSSCTSLPFVTIPNSVETIAKDAFRSCTSLATVTIGSSVTSGSPVTSIGEGAFGGCTNLASVTMGSLVASIGQSAFGGCTKLTSVAIGRAVTTIWPSAFSRCISLPSIVIPNSVTTIAGEAFSNCTNLATVTLPASVEVMGPSIFTECRKLSDLTVGWSTPLPVPANTFTNVNISGVNLHVPTGTEALYKATPVWKEFKIAASPVPEGLSWDLTSTMKATLVDGVLTVTTTQSAEAMPDYDSSSDLYWYDPAVSDGNAFAPWYDVRNDILSVVVSNGVTSIGQASFEECNSLSSVSIPASVASIGNYAFCGCRSLGSVTVPERVTSIGGLAFTYCNFASITIPAGVASIGEAAFAHCPGLLSVDAAPSNADYLSEGGVLYNKAKTLLLAYPAGRTATSFVIPNGVQSIGGGAFSGSTALASVSIPATVAEIRGWAFSDCPNLASIIIPGSVASIMRDAFYGCTGLADVTVQWAAPLSIESGVFTNVNLPGITLHVPAGTEDLYKAAPVWKEFKIGSTVGTEGINVPSLRAYTVGGNLSMDGLRAGEPLGIYNVTGQPIYKGIATGTEQTILLRNRGIYIIVAGTRSLKVIY